MTARHQSPVPGSIDVDPCSLTSPPSRPPLALSRPFASASILPHKHLTRSGCNEPPTAQTQAVAAQCQGDRQISPVCNQSFRRRRRSSAPVPHAEVVQAHRADQASQDKDSAIFRLATLPTGTNLDNLDRLFPPHYGRPERPSSPEVIATLLRPVFDSLSRPSSPARRLPESILSAAHPPTRTSADVEPATPSASSLPAHFPPREPTDPAPTVESQGFVLYVGSLVAYIIYILWAFLPGSWLEWAGVGWYPSQEWAILFPAWVVMLVAFTYSSYFFLNMFNTPALSSLDLLAGDPSLSGKAFVAPPPRPLLPDGSLGPSPLFAHSTLFPEDAIPPLYDLPQEWVDRVLYGSEVEEEEGKGGRLEEEKREKG
ncbi:hypothetical protein JCM11641_006082 [Rhodosporidiobolus odoratus]